MYLSLPGPQFANWPIFEIYWLQFVLQKLPKYLIAYWAIYKNVTFKVKPAVTSFWATVRKFGLLFIPTSGHTAGPKPQN